MPDRKRTSTEKNFTMENNGNTAITSMNNNITNNLASNTSSSTSGPIPPISVPEDSPDDVNFVIRNLGTPLDNVPTNVSKQYNNDSIMGNEIQAYAKIAGCNWTYYVKSLSISIGRNTEVHNNSNPEKAKELIDIDLGPSKVVSRKHATIEYNLNGRKWQLFVLGRNGLKVNGIRLNLSNNTPYDLRSGNIIDIGGTQMMFVLPDSPPVIPNHFRYLLSNKRLKTSNSISGGKFTSGSADFPSKSDTVNTQVKAFQLQEGISSLHPNSVSSEQDYSKDDAKDLKPPYSYATMITQAILSNPQGILSLAEIYDWISSHFAYYRHTKQGWQNSIRHNLSLNKAFEKVPRKPNEPGKGMKWQISEAYRNEFLKKWQDGSLNKVRRGTSVSRQLQLHLIKNNALPKGRASPTFVDETKNHSVQLPNPIQMQPLTQGNPNPSLPFNRPHDQQLSPHIHPPPLRTQEKLANPAYLLPSLSPNKNVHNDINFHSNSNLPSPIKPMSIPDINYLNTDQKMSSGLVSGLTNTSTSDQLLQTNSANDHLNSSKMDLKNSNSGSNINNNVPQENQGRPPYSIPSTKLQPMTIHNATDENQLQSLTSPKKIFNRMELMTPERNLQRPTLEPNSVQSQGSVNSSPALWNYVQFSTPLGPTNGTGNPTNGTNGENDNKLLKLELESPLKNRKNTNKVSDLKDVDLVKGFK